MKLIAATNNQGKVQEIKRILEGTEYTVLSLKDIALDCDVEETGATFVQNAQIKARAVYNLTKLPVIADDSGLSVDALNGEPGVYSARYSGKDATDEKNTEKLLHNMRNQPNRAARFVCALCYIDQNGRELIFEDECEGVIGIESVGNNGFGYDPVFMVGKKSFAQLKDEEKDAISHRGKVLRRFSEMIKKENTH